MFALWVGLWLQHQVGHFSHVGAESTARNKGCPAGRLSAQRACTIRLVTVM